MSVTSMALKISEEFACVCVFLEGVVSEVATT